MMQRNHPSCCFFWVNNIWMLRGGWLKRSSPQAGRNWWTSWCSAEPTAMSSMAQSVWEAPRTAAEALLVELMLIWGLLRYYHWGFGDYHIIHDWTTASCVSHRTVGWCCKGHRAGLGWRIQWIIEENIGKLVENSGKHGKMVENGGKWWKSDGKRGKIVISSGFKSQGVGRTLDFFPSSKPINALRQAVLVEVSETVTLYYHFVNFWTWLESILQVSQPFETFTTSWCSKNLCFKCQAVRFGTRWAPATKDQRVQFGSFVQRPKATLLNVFSRQKTEYVVANWIRIKFAWFVPSFWSIQPLLKNFP